ncbi:MAG: hypothetical protein IKG80_04700 [Clostridia bacterium]|nr:hypothetical protein [Clostridia bacterium]
MSDTVIVALISGGLGLIGVILTVYFSSKQTEKQIKAQADLTRYRIDQLEKKVDKHNQVIERTFKLEQRVDDLERARR